MADRLRRRQGGPTSGRPPRLPPGIGDATLVIAESIEAAFAAVAGGVPKHRVWALALPAERLHGPERAGFAVDVARAAEDLAGLLTDSDQSRDSLERAAATSRPKVEVFPPLAVDRACPEHAAGSRNGAQSTARDEQLPAPGAGSLHPAAAQLMLWQRMLAGATDLGVEGRIPFAAARVRGTVRQWAWSSRPGWRAEAARPPATSDLPEPVDWSSGAQARVARRIWEAASPRSPRQPRRSRAALVAGYDLKFARDLAERLGNRTDLDVAVDEWQSLARGTDHTGARLRQAESIFAEWARTSAIWYASRKRTDQFLAVRLHRFELDAPYPQEIDIARVDAVVYIAPLFGRRIRDELGWPVEKLVYIPNFLDLDWLDRPKLPEARFAIGFVGIEWSRKRFDLALDLLAMVRREDHRFTLVVRSTMPWHNKFACDDPQERDYVGRCFERIERDPWLRHAVAFDEPGRDMARWFRQIGHVLSTSDEEGCHTAVGEGMGSGAVPVVRPWPGAAEVYDGQWVHATVENAAAAVLENADADVWAERSARAQREIRQSHNPDAVVDAWAELLHREVAAARTYFAAYSDLSSAAGAPAATAPPPRRPAGAVTGQTVDGQAA